MKRFLLGVGVGLAGIAALAFGTEDPPIDADSPQLAKLAGETAQLRARLAQVEQQLRQQQEQHQQVEAMLRQTLLATATRLESLLGESYAEAPASAPAASAASGAAGDRTPVAQAALAAPPAMAARGSDDGGKRAAAPSAIASTDTKGPAAEARAQPARAESVAPDVSLIPPHRRPWLWLLAGSGACALAVLALRWGRAQPADARATGKLSSSDAKQPCVDAGTEALWATAHELGEPEPSQASAGGFATAAEPEQKPDLQPTAAVESAGAGMQARAEGLGSRVERIRAVSARERAADDAARVPPVPPEPKAHDVPVSATDRAVSRMPAADGPARLQLVVAHGHPDAPAAVELRLQIDPRVLKQPPPRVRVVQGLLEIDCALVPGLPPGDVAHLRSILQQTAAQ